MADDEKVVTSGSLHTEVMSLFKRLLGTQLFSVLLFGAVSAGVVLFSYKALAEEARRVADAGVEGVRKDVSTTNDNLRDVRTQLERHESQANQTHLELRHQLEEVRSQQEETQADIRALYRYQRTGLPQSRLEADADGGR